MDTLAKIICVVGPTASGKSDLAVELAQRLSGEVVSADSMQIYRGMDIGTAKPTKEEMRGIPHHMLGVAEPFDNYSAARYAAEAVEIVNYILTRGKVPVVAGGTGLYIDALIYGRQFPARAGDGGLRAKLTSLAQREGAQALYDQLSQKDPESAARLHPNDVKRVVRALEVLYLTGGTKAEHDRQSAQLPPRYEAIKIGLFYSDRQVLYARIDERVDRMLACGLVDEARSLLNIPGVRESTAMQAIGYKELTGVIDGDIGLAEAAELIKRGTRRYAKRQLTWFNRDKRIFWIDRCEYDPQAALLRAIRFLQDVGIRAHT